MAIVCDTSNWLDVVGTWTNLSPVSVCMWIRVNGFQAVSNRFFGSDNLFEIRCLPDGTVINELFQGSSTGPGSVSPLIVDQYAHLICTANQSTGDAKIYINGVLEGDGTVNTGLPTGTALSIGQRNAAPADQNAWATLDDVRIYNRIISDEEASTIYACKGSDGIYDGLVNYWKLKGVQKAVVSDCIDEVGGRTTTPVGSPTFLGSRMKYRRSYL